MMCNYVWCKCQKTKTISISFQRILKTWVCIFSYYSPLFSPDILIHIHISTMTIIMFQLQILKNHSWYAIIQNHFNVEKYSPAWCLITAQMVDMKSVTSWWHTQCLRCLKLLFVWFDHNWPLSMKNHWCTYHI